jgi:hypothetical protein
VSRHDDWPRAEIYEAGDGVLGVKILTSRGARSRWVYARRAPNGKITYDHPEIVPRLLKNRVVPELFKEIERRTTGVDRPATGQFRYSGAR